MAAVIAHRGGALLWPENSRRAIQGASALGVDQIQLDVRLSADSEAVVIHDATLDRTTTGTGPVETQSWDTLQGLRLKGTGEPMLRLQEAAACVAAGPARLRLEIKNGVDGQPYPGFAAKLLAILDQAGVVDRTILSAFGTETLARAALLRPAQSRALLVTGPMLAATPVATLIDQARAAGCGILGARWSALDASSAAAIHAAGLLLCCFGCDDDAALTAACELAADEVMTDRPDLALQRRRSPIPPRPA